MGGAKVHFVACGAHLQTMRKKGIAVEGGPEPIHVASVNATGWSGSWRIATARRNMSGGLGSFWRPAKAAARPRSCAAPACRSPASGAGSGGLWRLASTAVARQDAQAGAAALPAAVVDRVVELNLGELPAETTHWTGRAMAALTGISLRSVQRIWAAHGLEPHRVRRFKLTKDPAFAAKLRDVVGLYLDPPAHSLVLSVDEKSQIQALDRTQPGLPMKRGRAGTMTHDYVRHRTTTLFAALNLLDGTVIGQCMQRHRHQEFIRFLNRVEAVVPAGKLVHAILDIYVAHKHPKVCAWLVRHPRWTFHFTPTSCSASLAIRDILFPALGARGNAAECGRSGLFGPFFVSVGGAFL
jgi:DDE superfamily endonuclease